ncbi:Uncharacterised protein [Vibrio cholerae]|nr:Uncharacterised protein [Vibrio cholerae]
MNREIYRLKQTNRTHQFILCIVLFMTMGTIQPTRLVNSGFHLVVLCNYIQFR